MSFVSGDLPFERGDLFLGVKGRGKEQGLTTDRHAITIAGSRSGKGACVIIPNLLRWPDNVLVVDPKGENAEKTYQKRMEMGANVHIIDPFQIAEVPDQLRAAFNPLEGIDPESIRAGSDLKVIADGLVKRHDPKHAQWDNGAVALLAGIMAYVLQSAPPEMHNLTTVRRVLMEDRDEIYSTAQDMKQHEGCDGLAVSAGTIIMTAIETEKSIENDFLGNARSHTEWISMQAMKAVLEKSTFKLADLKSGNASVYLVLPPEYLQTHSAFLRLFVRCAINVMAVGGSGKGKRCLFILDEFFSLGRIDEISVSCGLMPSYGVHLWPFLQDLGQLLRLYGSEGAETFFANADLHQFFGNSDPMTLQHISQRLGVVGIEEMPDAPNAPTNMNVGVGNMVSGAFGQSRQTGMRVAGGLMGGVISGVGNMAAGLSNAHYQNQMNEYQQAMAQLGKPRYAPDEVGELVQRAGDVIAPNMICFISGMGPMIVTPAPYFRHDEKAAQEAATVNTETSDLMNHRNLFLAGILVWVFSSYAHTAIPQNMYHLLLKLEMFTEVRSIALVYRDPVGASYLWPMLGVYFAIVAISAFYFFPRNKAYIAYIIAFFLPVRAMIWAAIYLSVPFSLGYHMKIWFPFWRHIF